MGPVCRIERQQSYENLPGDNYYLDDDNFRVVGQDTGRVIQLGDEVRIIVKSVDLFKHKMDFEMLDDMPSKPKKKKKKQTK